jgi:BirA family biotin operon repressor/biotin-[acetyl-CoA-carboxylase] ligase
MNRNLTSAADLQRALADRLACIEVFPSLDSTNRYAREQLENGVPSGLTVALEQTAGRGRRGHTFFSPEGGLYMTVYGKPADLEITIQKLTIACAVAVVEAIQETTGIVTQIKWVNDIYLQEKKLCGILCEAPLLPDGSPAGVLAGIGINLRQKEFPPELADKAIALNVPDLSPLTLAEAITRHLLYWQARLADPALLDLYRRSSLVLHREVSFRRNDELIHGIATDINDMGNLLVELSDHTIVSLNSGEISLSGWQRK